MRGAIAFVCATAYGTSTRGISGINKDRWHSSQFSLVQDKSLELSKSPRGKDGALAASNRNPPADTLEVFKSNPAPSCLSLRHQPLGYAVVRIGHKAVLFLRTLLKQALSRFGAFRLQPRPKFAVTLSEPIDLASSESLTIAIGCYIDNTKVNAQKALRFVRWWLFNIASSIKEKLPIVVYQVRFALPRLQQFALALATGIRDALAAFHCPNRDGAIGFIAQNAIVVSYSAVALKDALGFVIELISICDFGDGAHHSLRSQAKAFFDVIIAKLMQCPFSKALVSPRDFRDVVTCVVNAL